MLYIVATPIGNLSEISQRAIDTLRLVDAIFCEDTRRTSILTNHLGISKPLVSYNRLTERDKNAQIIERLQDGQSIALVSDAGMPLISDPGQELVAQLQQEGLEYTVISGATACINALVMSGFRTQSFVMLGFLPTKTKDRDALVGQYLAVSATLIFYVAPHDLDDTLAYLFSRLGDRQAALARELTKMYEEVVRFSLSAPPPIRKQGEMVLVIEGKQKPTFDQISIADHLQSYLDAGVDKKQAIKLVAEERGIPKSEVYKQSHS